MEKSAPSGKPIDAGLKTAVAVARKKKEGRRTRVGRGGRVRADEIGNDCRSRPFEKASTLAICASGKCMLRWRQLRYVIDTTFLPI